jgi:hypothetical protein
MDAVHPKDQLHRCSQMKQIYIGDAQTIFKGLYFTETGIKTWPRSLSENHATAS